METSQRLIEMVASFVLGVTYNKLIYMLSNCIAVIALFSFVFFCLFVCLYFIYVCVCVCVCVCVFFFSFLISNLYVNVRNA